MSVAAYIERLRGELAGRTPKRLTRPLLGSVVFLLRDPQGKLSRFTVVLGAERADVLDGVHEQAEGPNMLIRAPLEAWTAFFHDGQLERMGDVSFYGDAALLETLAELLTLKISPLAMRISHGKPRRS